MWPSSVQHAAEPVDLRTTVLLQNLPRSMEVSDVCRLLDQLGLPCAYDVVFMRMRRRRPRRSRGHAVVNFLCPGSAAACIGLCEGMAFGDSKSQTACSAAFAECQGEPFVAKCMSVHLQRQATSSGWYCRMLGVT